METRKVVVIGVETIGPGLAVDLSTQDYEVLVNDIASSMIARTRDWIRADLFMYRTPVPAYRERDDETLFMRMTFTGDLAAVADSDMDMDVG
ncbi:MAG: 3-hydroxyacyl-CoA dehydrogenase NAD-binding domain-containing protein [Candidatus Tectomicrobia bacterium]|nr:3-hydroxyacyl-CoA dehydrogenase NAD-binding domain-containing protein [Candidatus Tectomicrobia bacterium]